MIRSRLEKPILVASALVLTALVPWFASCAESDAADDTSKDDASVVIPPDTSTDAGAIDAALDASCDASDPTCTASQISCDQADWCPVTTPVSSLYSLTSVWGSSKNDVWAAGSGGTIAHYDGAKWTLTPTPVRNTFHAVWGSGPTDVWAVSMTDALFHTTGFANGAAVWTQAPSARLDAKDSTPRTALAIWGTSSDDIRIGVQGRAVFDPGTGTFPMFNHYTKTIVDGGVGWSRGMGEGTVHAFWGASATDLWYLADNSQSQTNSWQKGMTMHGAADPDGGAFTWTGVDSQSTVVLEALWGSSANDIWAVGDMGVIRHMIAGAARWAIVPSPTTEALHAVWGSAANDVWAVGDHGTILHFDGTTWKPSKAALPIGRKGHLYGVWGSSANDVWIVGDAVTLHYTGPKPADQGGAK